jgi:hypothetical protein
MSISEACARRLTQTSLLCNIFRTAMFTFCRNASYTIDVRARLNLGYKFFREVFKYTRKSKKRCSGVLFQQSMHVERATDRQRVI